MRAPAVAQTPPPYLGATPAEVVFRDLHVVERDGGVFLYVTGQSIAQTVTQAQQGFMKFHAELDRSRNVRPLGEPRQLRIAEIEEEGRSEKAVLFSLDCELLIAIDREEG